MSARGWPWLVLACTPLLAHAPELLGWVSSNPLYFVSGLGHIGRPPLLDGSPGWIDPNAGFTTQALGREAARQWLRGQVPWWNHFSGVGVPLGAEMQGGALFLPFVLLLDAFDGVLYLKITLQILAGAASFALLRELGITRSIALLGGILYELNGTFAWTGHAPMLPVAFLPVILLGIERARTTGWRLLAIGIAYAFYAGFPETSVIYLLLALIWAGLRILCAPPAQHLRVGVRMFCGGLCGVLLASPAILPFLHYLTLADIDAHGARLPGLVAVSAAQILLPTLLGPPSYDWKWVPWGMAGGCIGLPLAAIAALAFGRGVRDLKLRIVLALWCVLALAISAGLIPFAHEIWFARYAPPSWEMAAIILAAFALNDWYCGACVPSRTLVWVSAAWSMIAACAVALAWPAMGHVQDEHPYFFLFPLLTLCLTIILGAVCARTLSRPRSSISARLLAGVLAGQALSVAILPLASGARNATYDKAAVHFLQDHLGQSRFFTLGPYAPNYGAFFGSASIDHNLLPVPRAWVDYTRAYLDPAADAISFTGAHPQGAVNGETRQDALAHRLSAYAAVGVKYVLAAPGTHVFTTSPSVDTPDLVFADFQLEIYELHHASPYVETIGGPCDLVQQHRDMVSATCRTPARLVRRELFFPGWHARANGIDLPITQEGGLFQAVKLSAGSHTVTFTYAPPGIGWAYACVAAGFLWLCTARRRPGEMCHPPQDPPSICRPRLNKMTGSGENGTFPPAFPLTSLSSRNASLFLAYHSGRPTSPAPTKPL